MHETGEGTCLGSNLSRSLRLSEVYRFTPRTCHPMPKFFNLFFFYGTPGSFAVGLYRFYYNLDQCIQNESVDKKTDMETYA